MQANKLFELANTMPMKACLPCKQAQASGYRRKKVKKTTFLNQEYSSSSVMPNEGGNQKSRIINIRTSK